jgi:signal peptidase I
MKRLFFLVALGALGALLVRRYVVEGIVIASASMEPRLPVGRDIFVNKMAYKFKPPQRGDVVVFPSPTENKDLVKRVIAVAGDEVHLENKKVILNDRPLDEPYVRHTRPDEILKGDNLRVGRVPPGHVFLLGDNRDESGDSRDWVDRETGKPIFFVSVDKLKGKLIWAD